MAEPAADPAGGHRRAAASHGAHAVDPLGRARIRPLAPRRCGAVARLRNATATSAGGIVVRSADGRRQLVVGSRRRDRDGRTWTLPKGTPKRGESTEETAVREVAEETGLEVRITGPLDSIQYVFVQSGTRIHKTVHYFLMEATGGDLADHDHEFEEVRWIDFDEAPRVLSFESERNLVAHAADVLAGEVTGGVPVAERAEAAP